MTRTEAERYRTKIEMASASTNDADALEMVELFPRWTSDRAVIVGERLQHEGKLWRCIQAHVTQEGWEPEKVPALWVRVSVEEWPEWIQPTGAADAYQTGDKVSHGGKHWVCNTANNVWEPGVYGWTEA